MTEQQGIKIGDNVTFTENGFELTGQIISIMANGQYAINYKGFMYYRFPANIIRSE